MRFSASANEKTEIGCLELPEMWLRDEALRPHGAEVGATKRERGCHRQRRTEDSHTAKNESRLP
jgi:hypothetical protein